MPACLPRRAPLLSYMLQILVCQIMMYAFSIPIIYPVFFKGCIYFSVLLDEPLGGFKISSTVFTGFSKTLYVG